MLKKNMAEDEYIELRIPRQGPTELSITTGPATAAAAEFVAEFQPWESATWVGLPIRTADGVSDSLVGSNKVGFVNIPAGEKVRLRRDDATGGNGLAGCDLVYDSPGRIFQ